MQQELQLYLPRDLVKIVSQYLGTSKFIVRNQVNVLFTFDSLDKAITQIYQQLEKDCGEYEDVSCYDYDYYHIQEATENCLECNFTYPKYQLCCVHGLLIDGKCAFDLVSHIQPMVERLNQHKSDCHQWISKSKCNSENCNGKIQLDLVASH